MRYVICCTGGHRKRKVTGKVIAASMVGGGNLGGVGKEKLGGIKGI